MIGWCGEGLSQNISSAWYVFLLVDLESREHRRIPIVVGAVLTGLAVMLAGTLPWSVLISANLSNPHSPPWAVPLMALYLTAYWCYLDGRGWPRRNAERRRGSLRARGLSVSVWLRALTAGVLAVAAAVNLQLVFARLVQSPGAVAQGARYQSYPWLTLLLSLLMGGAVSGIAEEAGFRGYMQSTLERNFQPTSAIAMVSVVFAAIHFSHGMAQTLPRLPYYFIISAIYGVLAYRTGSILPGLVIHASGDALQYVIGWRWRIQPSAPIGGSFPGGAFWGELAAGVLLGLLSLWAYRRLDPVASGTSMVHDPNQQT